MITLNSLPKRDPDLKNQNFEDGSFVSVIIQNNPGEINLIIPIDIYNIYRIQNGSLIWMWSIRSFNEYISLLYHGDEVLFKEIPIELSHIFYMPSLPEENRAEFCRRMKKEGLTLQQE